MKKINYEKNTDLEGFEPSTYGLEVHRPIQTRPQALMTIYLFNQFNIISRIYNSINYIIGFMNSIIFKHE